MEAILIYTMDDLKKDLKKLGDSFKEYKRSISIQVGEAQSLIDMNDLEAAQRTLESVREQLDGS
jgi:hypothetical protein